MYTAIMIFFLFTALTAQFADLDGFLNPEYSSHRYNAQIVAGVIFNSVERTEHSCEKVDFTEFFVRMKMATFTLCDFKIFCQIKSTKIPSSTKKPNIIEFLPQLLRLCLEIQYADYRGLQIARF